MSGVRRGVVVGQRRGQLLVDIRLGQHGLRLLLDALDDVAAGG
jgi:hypothetical protein